MKTLYETNFQEWLEEQISVIRKGNFENLDKENLIEEIESMGKSEYYRLQSHLQILLMHLLKIRYQNGEKNRSWNLSVKASKVRAIKEIKKNPGLKGKLSETFLDAYEDARFDAAKETGLDLEIFPEDCPWTLDEVLGEEI